MILRETMTATAKTGKSHHKWVSHCNLRSSSNGNQPAATAKMKHTMTAQQLTGRQ
jgi:hypothetical protein